MVLLTSCQQDLLQTQAKLAFICHTQISVILPTLPKSQLRQLLMEKLPPGSSTQQGNFGPSQAKTMCRLIFYIKEKKKVMLEEEFFLIYF